MSNSVNNNDRNQPSLLDQFKFHYSEGTKLLMSDFQSSLNDLNKALKIAVELDDPEKILDVTNELGKLFISYVKIDKAQKYLNSALKLHSKTENKILKAKTYTCLINLGNAKKDYLFTYKNLIQLNNITAELEDKTYYAQSFIGLANTCKLLGIGSSAEYFVDKAISIIGTIPFDETNEYLCIDIGYAYIQKEAYPKAIKYLNKAKDHFEINNSSRISLNIIGHLTRAYLKDNQTAKAKETNAILGKFTNQKEFQKYKRRYYLNEAEIHLLIDELNTAEYFLKNAITFNDRDWNFLEPHKLLLETYIRSKDIEKIYNFIDLILDEISRFDDIQFEPTFNVIHKFLKEQNDFEKLCAVQEIYIDLKAKSSKSEQNEILEQLNTLLLNKNVDDLEFTNVQLSAERRLNNMLFERNEIIEKERELLKQKTKVLKRENNSLSNEIKQIKVAETALEHYQKFLKLIIDQLPLLVIVFDRYGNIVITNWKKVNTLFEKTTITGTSIYDFFENEAAHRAYDKALDGEASEIHIEWRNLQVQKSIAPFSDDLNVTYVIDVSVDLTELIKKNKFLNKANEELKNYASMVSHDLQTPTRTISKFAEILMQNLKGQLSSTDSEYLNYILKASNRLNLFISDLLKYSSTGSHIEVPQISSIKDGILMAQNALKTEIQNSNAEIIINSKKELPIVKLQLSLLTSIFQNLFSNSIKFQKKNALNAPNHPEIKISYRNGIKDKQKNVCIIVEDNGIGIPEDKYEDIFNIFYRLNNEINSEGSGIGMASCKKIVELAGGHIWLSSQIGVGTKFYIELPKA